jgi:hypothetical protein
VREDQLHLLFNIFRQIRKEKLHLVIGDLSLALAQRKTNDHKKRSIVLDIYDNEQRKAIENADIVISMLPLICILK